MTPKKFEDSLYQYGESHKATGHEVQVKWSGLEDARSEHEKIKNQRPGNRPHQMDDWSNGG